MADTVRTVWIVRIELQRIQTFLFAVPRLRAMLGANALLGHAIRSDLPRLAKQHGAMALDWPKTIPLTSVPGDPLADPPGDWVAGDNPINALKEGVLSRDGGHLRIAFPSKDQARAFLDTARQHLAAALPDLLVSLDVFAAEAEPKLRGALKTNRVEQLAELPQLQVCTRSGFGVATEEAMAHDGYISAASKAKEDAGKRFQDGDSALRDYISLLRERIPTGYCRIPRDLEQLADEGRYIALIHADGNRVGKRIKAYEKHIEEENGALDWLTKECAVETFFHGMRGVVRAALVEALTAVFTDDVLAKHRYLPYQLLMLGGDDLLLLCQPRYALPFLTRYAEGLEVEERFLPDGARLSIGAGVVIAKHSLPFHRLHQLAEGLAASAKRAYLQHPDGRTEGEPPERSVADWAVLTSSWGEDPLEYRRRHDLVRYRDGKTEVSLALSAKPFFILEKHAPSGNDRSRSLESLLQNADTLAKTNELPRSQIKEMIRLLENGQQEAELAYRELLEHLSTGARSTLADAIGSKSPWISVEAAAGHRAAFTPLKDLIECLELRYLGRRKQEQDHD